MANRILILRKALQETIKKAHDQVFYENAPSTATYPYVVYTVSNSNDDGSLESLDLDVDGWDMPSNGSTIALETMMGDVDNQLHRFYFNLDGVFFMVYRENRRSLPDSDERLRRRQYIYQIRMMGVGQ